MISSISSTSLQSMQRASSGIVKEAKKICRAFAKGPPAKSIERSAVKMIQGTHQFNASAKLVKIADRMTGHVLDMIA